MRTSPDLSLPAALTMGDPCGIGPKIVARVTAARGPGARPLVVFGDAGILRPPLGCAVSRAPMVTVIDPRQALAAGTIGVIEPYAPLDDPLPVGRVDRRAGTAAHAYLQHAIDHALAGEVTAIVTAPLNKGSVPAEGDMTP